MPAIYLYAGQATPSNVKLRTPPASYFLGAATGSVALTGNDAILTPPVPAFPTFVGESETAWNSNTTPQSASVTVQTGDILVAFGAGEHSGGTFSLSGGGLTWTLQQQDDHNVTTEPLIAIWTAVASSNATFNVDFAMVGGIVFGGNVLIFRNSAGVGASAEADNTTGSGTPTVNLAVANHSAVIVASVDWNAVDGASRAWLTNGGAFTEQTYFRDPTRYTVYGGFHANSGSGTLTFGLSTPTGQRFGIVAVEVLGTSTTKVMTVTVGPFTLTGNAANLVHGRPMATSVGTFALTGNAANLVHGRPMAVSVGTFALTGNAANLLFGHKLVTTFGAFSLAGNVGNLVHGRPMAVTVAAFALTGNAANLVHGRPMAVSVGTFALTGNAANLVHGRPMATSVGTFTLTGNDANLTKSSATKTLTADTVGFTLTGNAAGLAFGHKFQASVGTFTLTGNSSNLVHGRPMATSVGAFSLTGLPAGFLIGHHLIAQLGPFTLTGFAASLTSSHATPSTGGRHGWYQPITDGTQVRLTNGAGWAMSN